MQDREEDNGAFSLVGAPVVVSRGDHPGVVRVAGDLRDDLERVTGVPSGDTLGRGSRRR
ncbi:hypothetical protein GT039_07530 [Streptomyces sp. SID2955]|nr:hypothetical protein [Streptomyces sp. SID2955]